MASGGRRVHTVDEGHGVSIPEAVTITECIASDEAFANGQAFTDGQAHARDESFTGDETSYHAGQDKDSLSPRAPNKQTNLFLDEPSGPNAGNSGRARWTLAFLWNIHLFDEISKALDQ